MANEAQWEVAPSSFTVNDLFNGNPLTRLITTSNPEEAKDPSLDAEINEPACVQVGSQLLYTLKELFVKAGWTVVQCSYRKGTEYVDGSTHGFWSKSGTPRPILTGGETLVDTDIYASNYFDIANEDKWKPQYGYMGGNLAAPLSPEAFTWGGTPSLSNPAWSVIYPDISLLGEDTSPPLAYRRSATETRKGLVSKFMTLSGSKKLAMGRSWILLKAPEGFREPHQQGLGVNAKSYYIVLDYVSGITTHPFAGTTNFKQWVSTDYDSRFGDSINIIVLPDYDPTSNDGLSNMLPDGSGGTYPPQPWIRPSHRNEVSCAVRSIKTLNTSQHNQYFRFIYEPENTHFINCINTVTTEQNGGIVLIGSSNGVPVFTINFGTIADSLPDDVIRRNTGNGSLYVGQRYFMFWSGISRWELGAAAKPSSTQTPIQINKTIATLQGLTGYIPSMHNTIFDARERYGAIYQYNVYKPNTPNIKFESRTLNTCFPSFVADISSTNAGTHILMASRPFAGSTSDYTFMEWPLPLIYVQGTSKNFNYAGRMMDVKLGPASGPNGILARESGSVEYDRLLMGGIWYPFSGTSTILF